MPAAQHLYANHNFGQLSPEIWYRKEFEIPKVHAGTPEVILLFAWMGATPQHVLKYSSIYRSMYPSATQIIIECPHNFFLKSSAQQEAKFASLIPLLRSLNVLVPSSDIQPAKTLLHVFSNGGACGLITLASVLSICPAQNARSTAIIFDSTPSKAQTRNGVMAFTITIRNVFLRLFARFTLTILFSFLLVVYRILGWKSIIERSYELVASSKNIGGLPFVGLETERLFIYGKKDPLIPYQDVQEAASALEKEGHNVKQLLFSDSAHVAHSRDYPEKYWSVVRELVETSFGISK
ncbi:hypothetical protein DL96DRAFT_1711540 [Flagelloscypha sp. PMI_526]|nr:hypothetical protein DL96DRAFT_1711540 [Flagelloscypha sp. PMI_526]